VTDNITHYDAVEAYCSQLSYAPGETAELHVRCTTDRYDVAVFRWGAERIAVWSVAGLVGTVPATPGDADSNGCGWPVSLEIPIADDWASGFYHVELTAHGAPAQRSAGHACFVVRAGDRSPAKALLVVATNTYNAYNTWGGRSLYTGGKQVSFDRPFGRGQIFREAVERDDRKSRPTRWGEEPDIDGVHYNAWRAANGYAAFAGSAGWFTFERRFVEWAERNGFAFDYAVSSDLAQRPGLLDGYELVIGVGHDEYWSAGQRNALEAYVADGGNYATFSGNTSFWQVRLVDDGRSMVCHKYRAHLDDPVMGTDAQASMSGMWADPIVGRPEAALLGAGSAWGLYSRYGIACGRGSGAFTVYRNDHWLFAGTGLRYGDLLGSRDGVIGYETVGCRIAFDEYQLPIRAGGDSTPEDMEIVAFTPSSNLAVGEYPKSTAAPDDQGDLEFIAERIHGGLSADSIARARYGNSVMLVARPFGASGGEVVTIGTTDWVFGLADDPAVGQVTRNVLERFV
jgi:hypothetical protein